MPRHYVVDEAGKPYPLFFLLLTTGEAEAEQLYALDATEIARDFSLGSGDRATHFSIPASRVFRSDHYEVTSRRLTLDRIERAILEADRDTRERFFGVSASPEVFSLDPDLTIPLMNWYGPFDDALREVKRGISTALYDMEDTLEVFRRILGSGDPVEVEDLLEDRAVFEYLGRSRDQVSFGFGSHNVFNDDFFNAARDYRERLHRLRAAGLEAPYVKLFTAIDAAVQRALRRVPPTPVGRTLRWTLEYDPVALAFVRLTVRTVAPPAGEVWPARGPVSDLDDHPIVSRGRVVAVMGLGPFPPHPPMQRFGGLRTPWTPPTWTEFVHGKSRRVTERLARLVEAEHFGDDL